MFLTDFSQVRRGLRWADARFSRQGKYRAWYEGKESTLWSGYDWPEGLSYAGAFYTYFNWFRLVSDFWRLACAADDAVFSPGVSDGPELLDQLSLSESVSGYLVARKSGSDVRAVDASHWVPVLNTEDGDQYRGHVLGYPWRRLSSGENPNEHQMANMIDFHLVGVPGGNVWRRYVLEGFVVADRIFERRSPIDGVYVEGDGLSEYGALEAPTREYAVRMSLASKVLGRHSSPHMQGPSSAVVQNVDGTIGVNIPSGGAFLPRGDKDEAEYEYVVWDGQMQAHDAHLQRVVDWIHSLTGIPLATMGSGSGLVESGASYERAMFAAVSKVRRTRRRIASLLGRAGVDVSWQLDPFESKSDRTSSLVELVGAGIVSEEESRRLLGYGRP